MSLALPVLYSFRRCPYAMRARWAIGAAGVAVELREVALRAKPAALLAASPKGTVPVLVLPDGRVIEQSLDVMRWALAQHDPQGWLTPSQGGLNQMLALVDACERDFKPHLDRAKYALRYRAEWGAAGSAADERAFADRHCAQALSFMELLAQCMRRPAGDWPYLMGDRPALADFAIAPFVRQFARHDAARVAAAAPPAVLIWLQRLLARPDFAQLMQPQAVWSG